MRQAEQVLKSLRRAHPKIEFVLQVVKTQGDVAAEVPISHLGVGAFVRELEAALLRGDIQIAVHSLKDLPSQESPGLLLAAVPPREDPRDVLVSRWGCSLEQLPQGARVGTGSLRRAAQMRAIRPDLSVEPIRGNIDTRLRKAASLEWDGVILAAAGLHRLGWQDRIAEYLPLEVCLPAVGQAALAVQVRAQDMETRELVAVVDDEATHVAVAAERSFLDFLGGGCAVPIAAYGEVQGDHLALRGMVASSDGTRLLRGTVRGSKSAPEDVGRALARELLSQGAGDILARES